MNLKDYKDKCYAEMNDFEKKFFINLELLTDRINKFKNITIGTIDYWTYYDAIITQFRALLIESPNRSTNYTFQNYLKTISQNDTAQKIDDYLNNYLFDEVTIRKAIKVSADKFIVHYDTTSTQEINIEQLGRTKLTDQNNEFSLYNIIKNIYLLMIKGFSCSMEQNCKFK